MHKREYIGIFFIVTLLISNLMAVKIAVIGPFTLPAAVLIYPFCFMLGDVMTELWGFRYARSIIFTGFAANILMVIFLGIGQALIPAASWGDQAAYAAIFGLVPRIVLASILGYLAGELLNSLLMVKIKARFQGSPLFIRTIGSSMVGQFFDTGIFITVAFAGLMPTSVLLTLMLSQYIFKVLLEAVAGTPLAYFLIRILGRGQTNSF